jgi:hypothetical protein
VLFLSSSIETLLSSFPFLSAAQASQREVVHLQQMTTLPRALWRLLQQLESELAATKSSGKDSSRSSQSGVTSLDQTRSDLSGPNSGTPGSLGLLLGGASPQSTVAQVCVCVRVRVRVCVFV